jgi:prepilin-type N-terminal cleavage/methylation domain-containing protein
MKQRGFTLLEVMIGLALLGFALVVLLKSAAGSIYGAQSAQMMGVATDLARAKMNDIEETLLKDGFNETDLSDADEKCDDWKPFEEEGWPNISWCAKVVQVELPSWQDIQDLTKARSAVGSGSAGSGSAGSDGETSGGFEDSALGGLMGMLGGGLGAGGDSTNIESLTGGGLVQQYYTMFQEVLKDSVRKVSLEVRWEVLGTHQEMMVVAFFTDAAAMDKVLQGLGSQDLDDAGSGSGSDTGSSKTNSNTRTNVDGRTKK